MLTTSALGRRFSFRSRTFAITVALLALGLVLTTTGIVWSLSTGAPQKASFSDTPITWPATGDAALALGDVTTASPEAETARPIASLTKLVTALVVLERLPLAPNEPGPSFALDDTDAQFARSEAERGGITVPVEPGKALTARQLLELMLVASSNNHATSLVTHLYGDEQGYLIAAREWLDARGLSSVEIADASGMSPENRASAVDLLAIGRAALRNPVIVQITELAAIPAPGQGMLRNTNDLLGTQGISGLKTGSTAAAGSTIVFVVPAVEGSQDLLGVVLGSPSRVQRSTDVTRLIAQVRGFASH